MVPASLRAERTTDTRGVGPATDGARLRSNPTLRLPMAISVKVRIDIRNTARDSRHAMSIRPPFSRLRARARPACRADRQRSTTAVRDRMCEYICEQRLAGLQFAGGRDA